jgi:hypothetical protein
MKCKRLFTAIGNIDERFIEEDAEEIAINKGNQNARKRRVIYTYAGIAACAVILLFSVFSSLGSLNPSIDNGQQAGPPPYMLSFSNGFESLAELEAITSEDDKIIAEYLDNNYYSYNGLSTREDIESLMSTLRGIYLPFAKTGDVPRITVFPERNEVTLRYEFSDGFVYVFDIYYGSGTAEKYIAEIEEHGKLSEALPASKDGFIVYDFIDDEPDDVRQTLILDVNGVYVIVWVWDANDLHSMVDLQTAVDGLMDFEFNGLVRLSI